VLKIKKEPNMPYDEALAHRIRAALSDLHELTEKKMFGGISFLVGGNLACGVSGPSLMVRIGPADAAAALAQPAVRPLDMAGRPMKGWVLVEPAGLQSDTDLRGWVNQGVALAQSLPPK
jgi:TfoX/Sxy family transcriptional regulator of competence genes